MEKKGDLGKQQQQQQKPQPSQADKEKQAIAAKDDNINPLLNNGITNRDVIILAQILYQIFRTLLFHFKTDNYIPIEGAAKFVVNLLKRPVKTKYDEEAEQRFFNSLVSIMKSFSFDGRNLNENAFCKLMQSFETFNDYEFTDQQQYDMFLERLFFRIKHKKTDQIQIEDFKELIERAGFKFEKGEFENLIKWYFRNKETITLEEFKLFATGNCVKLVDNKKK